MEPIGATLVRMAELGHGYIAAERSDQHQLGIFVGQRGQGGARTRVVELGNEGWAKKGHPTECSALGAPQVAQFGKGHLV